MIQTIIIDWLKEKQNYIGYKVGTDDFFQFEDKLAKLYGHGRVHYSDLGASECYIIESSADEPDSNSTKHYRHNFKNFNIPRIEYIYDKIKLFDYMERISVDLSIKNRYMGLDLLNELSHSYRTKKKFIKKSQKFTYQDIFYNIKESDISQVKNDVFYQHDGNNFQEFVEVYELNSEGKNLQDIGLFFPFKLDHDIFEHKHFLFEINPVKFFRKGDDIFTIAENFYEGYGVNTTIPEKLLSIEQYFIHPGLRYLEEFAYFDPLKNYQKYKKDYKKIINAKVVKKFGFKNFVFDLFEVLNQAQINVVKFQHENLINAISTYNHSKDRQKSIRTLIESEIKTIEEKHLYKRSLHDYQHYTVLLALLNSQSSDEAFTTKTKVKNMEIFHNAPETIKQYAQLLLDNYCSILNKGSSSKLKYIHDYYKNKIKVIAKKYKLNLEESRVLNEMLLDLIYFYGDRSKEKLSRPFNTTIAEIYKKHQRKNLEDIVDFDFQAKFIQKYNYIFERYRPIVLNKNLSA